MVQVANLESRLQEVGVVNKDLTNLKFELEASVRELAAKLKSSEEVKFHQTIISSYNHLVVVGVVSPQECGGMREELQKLRRENSALDAGSHEQDKVTTQLRTRLTALEQELQDKEQVRRKSNGGEKTEGLWRVFPSRYPPCSTFLHSNYPPCSLQLPSILPCSLQLPSMFRPITYKNIFS